MKETTLTRADGTVVCERCSLADSPVARMRGLLGRDGLEQGEGLLLRPASSIHTFFMRFPIDAVFLGKPDTADGDTRPVVSVHSGLKAWTGLVPLVRGADGVLELPAGTIERSGTVVGDRVAMEPIPAG